MTFCARCGRPVEGPAIVQGDEVRHPNCPHGADVESPVLVAAPAYHPGWAACHGRAA